MAAQGSMAGLGVLALVVLGAFGCKPHLPVRDEPRPALGGAECQSIAGRRTVCADVAALDQALVYNRFGSFNPYGMIFALERDLVPASEPPRLVSAEDCNREEDGTTLAPGGQLQAGEVRLRDCKRPRPLTLRANVGDVLRIRLVNYLRPDAPGFSQSFCRGRPDAAAQAGSIDHLRSVVSRGTEAETSHGEAACGFDDAARAPEADPQGGDWPAARTLSFAIQGLNAVPVPPAVAVDDACRGLRAISPGETVHCAYEIDREGPYFLSSNAAPSGGEGAGGSITHGLFGAVIAEQRHTRWYRSQVSSRAFDSAWHPAGEADKPHARKGPIDYEAKAQSGVPILNMLQASPDPQAFTLVHSDLNAIVWRAAGEHPAPDGGMLPEVNFREFSVFFHDELKTFYARNFEELGMFDQLAGVRDGFAINYGASGMGTMLLANRKRIGPAADCVECLYEEFFLTSWANGDPALLEHFGDDPSNVHHSYLNDAVVFRNFHAGPKETHVFHLHAHQWFAGNDAGRGAYLDSQTVAPQQAFSYEIYRGGLDRHGAGGTGKGWWDTLGAGNRNRTPGDSIFHCHLYPHFAQGMWSLWRVHDVLEDGSRRLPDGQAEPGLSLTEVAFGPDAPIRRRPGSVDPITGVRIKPDPGGEHALLGTPIPALVPLPDSPAPLLPSYPPGSLTLSEYHAAPASAPTEVATMPGYPFYIAGAPGHRPPQAPMDIAIDTRSKAPLDGGLPRHRVADGGSRALSVGLPDGMALPPLTQSVDQRHTPRERTLQQLVAKMLALGDMTAHFEQIGLTTLAANGTPLERAAMGFHHDGKVWREDGADSRSALELADVFGAAVSGRAGGYDSPRTARPDRGGTPGEGLFAVNGAPPKPGAPFADPCGMPDDLRERSGVGKGSPDPFVAGLDSLGKAAFSSDPEVTGFRRYEVSAVQLDLVTNRAGWHDPQARINVLSTRAHAFKDDAAGARARRISPIISGEEEPFFFRAMSGECIEFRHTNELPKELALDDFQVRTPTDTVGQHIHLVKFDVMASDGSANGFNYEDGTFAPDEVAARLCAGQASAGVSQAQPLVIAEGLCNGHKPARDDWWRFERKPGMPFQTTVQRWFADPILSPGADGKMHDRTLRTVFSHDHFGPSSIQQHGFYSALVIEPARSAICGEFATSESDCVEADVAGSAWPLQDGNEKWVGARKLVITRAAGGAGTDALSSDPAHPDYREFALAIADFATLYDPRDLRTAAEVLPQPTPGAGGTATPKGMATLLCELDRYGRGNALASCSEEGDPVAGGDTNAVRRVPAWLAAGRPGDVAAHGLPSLFDGSEFAPLRKHLLDYRRLAAGNLRGKDGSTSGLLASPVAAPQRPESISVDHHDPYLVNYRGEPLPLRIGDRRSGSEPSAECALDDSVEEAAMRIERGARSDTCSVTTQLYGERGDMANVFLSSLHQDPATPVFSTYTDERVVFRLIQGAQEVQHSFNLEGYTWNRNIDQAFASMARAPELSATLSDPARARFAHWCQTQPAMRDGRPEELRQWLREGPGSFAAGSPAQRYWSSHSALSALCDNINGRVAALEVGISEHFEIAGAYRDDNKGFEAMIRQPYNIPTDVLYHFGSVDALWNGAWGLLRVLPGAANAESDGVQASAPRPTKLSDARRELGWTDGSSGGEEAPNDRRDANPVIDCPLEAPRVHAAIAAVETAAVWSGNGTPYGNGLHDPDGLFFAQLDPLALANPAPAGTDPAAWLESPAAWERIPFVRIIDQIRASYARPEPMVLNVAAGDCVELTVINAMRENLGDAPGDARMPPIVPLNVEPSWQATDLSDGARHWVRARQDSVRPSARLAVQIPLPTLNHNQDIALPFGGNRTTALVPVPSDGMLWLVERPSQEDASGGPTFTERSRSIERLRFYAGRASMRKTPTHEGARALLNGPGFTHLAELRAAFAGVAYKYGIEADTIELELVPVALDAADISIGGEGFRLAILNPADDGPDYLAIVGDAEAAGYEALSKAFGGQVWSVADGQAFLAAARRALQAEFLQFHPYAFGALPVRSFGDVIGHAVHGLFGTIVVGPIRSGRTLLGDGSERLPDKGVSRRSGEQCDPVSGHSCSYVATGPRRDADGRAALERGTALYSVKIDGREHRIREFVLFYQDGLNLHDDGSRNLLFQGGALLRGADGRPYRPVSDCAVCDDSYDLGKQGVNYRSEPFHVRLRDGSGVLEGQADLNTRIFPANFFTRAHRPVNTPVLRAEEGEELVIRVLHPGGRARQRAFVTIGQAYDDLFPGFGFPNAALLAPGKGVAARLSRPVAPGCYLWHDGPVHLWAGGTWGLLEVAPASKAAAADRAAWSCDVSRQAQR